MFSFRIQRIRLVRSILALSAWRITEYDSTGQVVHGEELKALCEVCHEGVTLVLDEFYSQYIYDLDDGATVTGARYVKDVNKDSIVLIDGLTKNYRYPGFRVAWVVGPESLIRAIGQSGGALDGGAAHLLQVAALTVFKEPERSQEQLALQNHFRMKRDYVLCRLAKMGLEVTNVPNSTFYVRPLSLFPVVADCLDHRFG